MSSPKSVKKMNFLVSPESPHIFLGQNFTIQVTIPKFDQEIKWISAQIAGKVRALNSRIEPLLQNLISEALGAPQQAPYFGHVMSGSRLIGSEIKTEKVYCLTINAQEIPPSYDGVGINISYELRISVNVGTNIVSSTIPLKFIGPFNSHFVLKSVQHNSIFNIESVESLSIPSPYSLACPYQLPTNRPIESFLIKDNEHGEIACIRLCLIINTGSLFTGIIEVKNAPMLKSCKISITRSESYSSGVLEKDSIANQNINLVGIVAKSFALSIPFTSSSEFSTELFKLKYQAEIILVGESCTWNWSSPLCILPPVISLSVPRSLAL